MRIDVSHAQSDLVCAGLANNVCSSGFEFADSDCILLGDIIFKEQRTGCRAHTGGFVQVLDRDRNTIQSAP